MHGTLKDSTEENTSEGIFYWLDEEMTCKYVKSVMKKIKF